MTLDEAADSPARWKGGSLSVLFFGGSNVHYNYNVPGVNVKCAEKKPEIVSARG